MHLYLTECFSIQRIFDSFRHQESSILCHNNTWLSNSFSYTMFCTHNTWNINLKAYQPIIRNILLSYQSHRLSAISCVTRVVQFSLGHIIGYGIQHLGYALFMEYPYLQLCITRTLDSCKMYSLCFRDAEGFRLLQDALQQYCIITQPKGCWLSFA